ncbi:MAG TPA: TldD/PmbA family protein [candidate division WOR-3 bacterium]|uniref:TldD/PmbA family protein n=1 Tax=candidate division WOR-3 bacterium TaxID=2052148 RepID=A0A7V0T463_UNCW3|nr:TldD/PmbA family protein [candidate division WOR-3 bacterium]
MDTSMPESLNRLRPFLPELVAEVRKRAPHACALVTRRGGTFVVKSPHEETVNPIPPDPGIRISAWDGTGWRSLATARLDDRDYLLGLARELAGSLSVKDGPVPETGPALDRHFRTAFARDPLAVETAERQALVSRIQAEVAGRDKRVAMARAAAVAEVEYRLFCDGPRLLSSETIRSLLFTVAIAVAEGRQVQNYDSLSGSGWEALSGADKDWSHRVADDAVACLDAVPIDPGEHICVLDPDITGTLAHESFGHGCEMDTLMRGAARAAYFVGKRVGCDLVNIVDEPDRPGTAGTVFFSDDGVLAEEPVVLVRNGILQPTLMCDRYSYLMMKDRLPGLRQSASGRLESWNHPIYARMTCTYFVPRPTKQGGLTKEEMIAATDRGVLLERLTSGMEDPLGWGVQLQVLRGREIAGGKLTGRLHYKLGVTGYVPDVLASVDAVGTGLDTSGAGMCGKGHKEWVRNASGGPWLRCKMKLG